MERELVLPEDKVYACTGGQQHAPNCDGTCEVLTLDPIEVEINRERKKWEILGMVPVGTLPHTQIPGIPIDTLILQISLHSLCEALYEIFPDQVKKDELNNRFRMMYLERLRTVREMNEGAMREAKTRAALAVPGAEIEPQLIVPDFIKMKERKH